MKVQYKNKNYKKRKITKKRTKYHRNVTKYNRHERKSLLVNKNIKQK